MEHILAPSNPLFTTVGCNQFNANLTVASIKLDTATNSFAVTDPADPIGPGGAPREVVFRGKWKTDTLVTGTTRISGDGCDHTDHWRMHLVS